MNGRCISNECLGTTGFSYTLSLINGKYKPKFPEELYLGAKSSILSDFLRFPVI